MGRAQLTDHKTPAVLAGVLPCAIAVFGDIHPIPAIVFAAYREITDKGRIPVFIGRLRARHQIARTEQQLAVRTVNIILCV